MAALAMGPGVFAALGLEYLRVAGVAVAPAQVVVYPSGLHDMVRAAGIGKGELAQHLEVGLDRVRPGGVGGGETPFNVVTGGPAADLLGGVNGEVVPDNVDRFPVGTDGRPGCF